MAAVGKVLLMAALLPGGAVAAGWTAKPVASAYVALRRIKTISVFLTERTSSARAVQYDYVTRYFDSFHTTGVKYFVADNDDYIRRRVACENWR